MRPQVDVEARYRDVVTSFPSVTFDVAYLVNIVKVLKASSYVFRALRALKDHCIS